MFQPITRFINPGKPCTHHTKAKLKYSVVETGILCIYNYHYLDMVICSLCNLLFKEIIM